MAVSRGFAVTGPKRLLNMFFSRRTSSEICIESEQAGYVSRCKPLKRTAARSQNKFCVIVLENG